MSPRPYLHSLLLMAASASSTAAAAGGDSGLLFAARRRLPVAAASMATASGCFTPRRDASPGGPRWPAVCSAHRTRGVHSANYTASSEERLGQLIQKLKNEGINPKQWKLGNFQHMLCPQCNGGSKGDLSLSVYIRRDGMNATWNCLDLNVAGEVLSSLMELPTYPKETLTEKVKLTKRLKLRKPRIKFTEKSVKRTSILSHFCEEVSKSTFDLMEALGAKVVAPIMQKLDPVAGQVDDLSKKVDAIVEKLDAAAGQVDDLSKKVDAMVEKLDAAAGQVDDLSKKGDAKAEKLDAVAGHVDDLSKVDAMAEKLNAPTADNK